MGELVAVPVQQLRVSHRAARADRLRACGGSRGPALAADCGMTVAALACASSKKVGTYTPSHVPVSMAMDARGCTVAFLLLLPVYSELVMV